MNGLRMVALLVLVTSASARADDPAVRLAAWLAGSFSSQEQAVKDSAFLDIRLHMVPIWEGRDDGLWLYVEQATVSHQDRPYRQRVYRIRQRGDSTVESAVFELPAPERFAGSWAEPARLSMLAPDSLLPREGCAILLRQQGDSAFVGATVGRECESRLRGAVYATSVVLVTDSVMISWDRGWDSQGTQVWGAVSGGYIFRKLEAYPLRGGQRQ